LNSNDYYKANKNIWNERVEEHVNSDFYDNQSFLKGRNSLNSIELDILGSVKNKRILHLQCHFGQDSLSLARMGADVTGVDISDQAISKAKELNDALNLNAEFVCCNVLDIDKHVKGKFDLIFASYGTIGWLETLDPYFQNVAHFLKRGGQYLIVDFHPTFWIFNEDFSKVAYSYFNEKVIIDEMEGSYASENANPKMKEYGWNHPFDEIFKAVHQAGLTLNDFKEYDFSPYDLFSDSTKTEKGFQIKGLEGKIPLVYSILITKG